MTQDTCGCDCCGKPVPMDEIYTGKEDTVLCEDCWVKEQAEHK